MLAEISELTDRQVKGRSQLQMIGINHAEKTCTTSFITEIIPL